MSAVSWTVAAHVGATLVAVLTLLRIVVDAEVRRSHARYLAWAAAGAIVWTLSVASVKHTGVHPWHQALWFPSVAYTTGALVLWSGQWVRWDWRPRPALTAAWLAYPTLLVGARLAGGVDIRPALFVVNSVYCLALLLVFAAIVARRADDPSPAARALARFLLVTAVGVMVAESFRLNVTDIVVALALAVVTAFAVRGGDAHRARPAADVLIDDLGALLLVFDADQRLVDLNAPARLFYTTRGAAPPAYGTSAAGLVGFDLTNRDSITVDLATPAESVRFNGYVQRLPATGTPSRGWVCLLRRSTTATPTQEASPGTRRTLVDRAPGHDPAMGVLSASDLDQALASAERSPGADRTPAVALVVEVPDPAALASSASAISRAWDDEAGTVAVGRCGDLRLGIVVQNVSRTAAWERTAGAVLDHGVRLATGAGTVARARDLLEETTAQLDAA